MSTAATARIFSLTINGKIESTDVFCPQSPVTVVSGSPGCCTTPQSPGNVFKIPPVITGPLSVIGTLNVCPIGASGPD